MTAPHDGAAAEPTITPRSDGVDGLGWTLLGVAVLIGSLAMDRLERQGVNPYTVPGLLPGLLGIAMILLGTILALRSWRRGALRDAAPPITEHVREQRRRVGVAMALCLAYGGVLIGHGLPFWLASTVYVSGSILTFQRLSRDTNERRLTAKSLLKALLIGAAAAVLTQLAFQELFLVRLP
ncbi:MAG: tripartite tricarboxylate transporter TctB family protein [Burkholderiales bacterium]|nr:tripartite tricarboxylate transporter TctB family protein [Burkholderiales bacterium]